MRLFLSLLLVCGIAHAAEIEIQSLKVSGTSGRPDVYRYDELHMPFVKTNNPHVTANINDRLFIGQFEALAPKTPPANGKLSARVLSIEGLAEQEYRVVRKDNRLLTLTFDLDGCGAYCENFHVFYSFDLRNGRMLTTEDMFTPNGRRVLAKRLRDEKVKLYRDQIVQLERELATLRAEKPTAKNDDIEDTESRLELNHDCEQRVRDEEDEERGFFYAKWEFAAERANLHAGRCSNHAMRALDDVGDVQLSLPYSVLRPHLTSYGRTVLFGEGDVRAKSFTSQVLRGRLGGQEIVMLLEQYEDASISGTYYYQRYGKPINLSGQTDGATLTLKEAGEDNKPAATFTLAVNGSALKGTWKGDKTREVQLTAP